MSSRLTAWLRLSACPEGSREHRVSQLIQQVGLSGVAERCGVTVRDVEGWVLLRQVPEEFGAALDAKERATPIIDTHVAQYRAMRAQGMTMQAIADELGVTKQAVSKGLKSNDEG